MLMVFFGPNPVLAGMRNLLRHRLAEALDGRLAPGPEESHAVIA